MRGRWHGTYTAWTCNSQLATAESPTATQRPKRALRRPYSSTPLFVASRLRPRCLELADDRNGVLRLWPDGVVRVDICRPDPSVLVDDVASRHRQPKVGLVVKLVERVAERRVELLQIRWKREREPKGLGDAQVQIGQDVKLDLRAPTYARPYCGSSGESATIEAPTARSCGHTACRASSSIMQ